VPLSAPRHGAVRGAAALASLSRMRLSSCAATSTYTFSTLYINAPPNTPFAIELKRTLGGSSAKLVDSAATADVVLDLGTIVDDKQVLSLSGGGRAREYALTKRVTFALHDTSGKDWMPAGEILVRRSYTSTSPKCSRASPRKPSC
jgi:outer membrane lipopolysaccharide assembly protein LptE/RlpB